MSLRRPLIAAAAGLLASAVCLPARAADRNYALSVMHFNVQYVAGGLVGFFSTPDPAIDKTAIEVEDAIVVQSFEPVLDLFLAHPTWGSNIELQGYMLDVMAERHPGVLDKLRTLSTSGQIEVMSFHYGDSLFMAYPPADWQRSQALTRQTFEKHGVTLGKAVFCQEGQAGPGMAEAMAQTGYETLIFPKNLFSFLQGDAVEPAPLYQFGPGQMLTSRGLSFSAGGDNVSVNFWFVDDGELLATGDYDPYIVDKFKTSPEALAETEASLSDLEAAGYQITTVSKYVADIATLVTPVEPPPLLDGTWQPGSTDGIYRWLGGSGLWWKDERDNDVRTLGALAHRELLAAEVAAAAAGIDAAEDLDGAYRLLALGQVTDGTGINPFRGEIEYAIAHFTEILRIARAVLRRSKEALGASSLCIDTATATVAQNATPPPAASETTAPFEVLVESGDRTATQRWSLLGPGHYELEIQFSAGDERLLSARFPGTPGDIVYTPGLADQPVHVPREAFAFEHFDLALQDGLIGLGGGYYVIKDQGKVHVGARIETADPDVLFHDDTAPAGEETTWTFQIVEGDEAAAQAAARALNVTPELCR